MRKLMLTLVLVATLALAVTSAQAAPKTKTLDAFSEGASGEAYREGVSDWLGGLCYRARPYDLDGPSEKAAAWERGWHDAKQRVPKPVARDDSVCFPGRP
jgi:hypothetical protein